MLWLAEYVVLTFVPGHLPSPSSLQVVSSQWDEWNRLLAHSPAAPLNTSASPQRPSESLGQLYKLAVELRDKLRYRYKLLHQIQYYRLFVRAWLRRSWSTSQLGLCLLYQQQYARLLKTVVSSQSLQCCCIHVHCVQSESSQERQRRAFSLSSSA